MEKEKEMDLKTKNRLDWHIALLLQTFNQTDKFSMHVSVPKEFKTIISNSDYLSRVSKMLNERGYQMVKSYTTQTRRCSCCMGQEYIAVEGFDYFWRDRSPCHQCHGKGTEQFAVMHQYYVCCDDYIIIYK